MAVPRSLVPASLDPAGPAARDLADLWWLLLIMGGAIFLLVLALLLVPMVRRRRSDGADEADGHRAEVPRRLANRWIVGLGVVLTGVVLIVVLVVSVATMRDVSRAASSARP